MDNPNINDAGHDRKEWWEAFHKEQKARSEKLDAEARLKHNDALENLSEEFDAAGDWAGAKWDEFKARAQQWSNRAEVETDEAI